MGIHPINTILLLNIYKLSPNRLQLLGQGRTPLVSPPER